MSFLLDPPTLLLIGILVSKINYLTVIFDDNLLTRGSSRKNIFIVGLIAVVFFWIYSSLLYFDIIYFPWPLPQWFEGTDFMLNSGLPLGLVKNDVTDIFGTIIFATYPFWYYFGSKLGLSGINIRKKQILRERDRILTEVVRTTIPKGGAIPPGAEDVDAVGTVIDLFNKIPSNFHMLITILLFVIDSRFFVFVITRKWSRFINLDADKTSTKEKRKYMEVLEANPYLSNISQILKLISCFGYYTKQEVWKFIDYEGPLIPKDPPWFNPGPALTSSDNSEHN